MRGEWERKKYQGDGRSDFALEDDIVVDGVCAITTGIESHERTNELPNTGLNAADLLDELLFRYQNLHS